jgi:hypothetical protein
MYIRLGLAYWMRGKYTSGQDYVSFGVLGGVWWTIAIKMSSALFTLQLTLVN